MSEPKLSKYAAKVKRREEEALRAAAAEKIVHAPTALKLGGLPTPRFPHPTPQRREIAVADIAGLRDACSRALQAAADLLGDAARIAERMVAESASPMQQAEPRSIWQFAYSTRLKVATMALRSKDIPTAKEAATC